MVQVIVINEQTLLDLSKIELKSEADKLFASNPQAFTQQYGNSFVYGLITGGEFLGVLEIESSSAYEFREIKASLSGKASYGLFSGDGKATFEQSLEKITSSYKMKATVLRRGDGGVLSPVTPSQLVKDALEFPSKVTGSSGFPYEALVIPYNHIPHSIASPLDVSNQATVLDQLGAWRQRLVKYQNDLAFALDHQAQFPGIDIKRVNDRYNQINSEIAKIVSAASDCFTDQAKCALPSIDLTLLENILPSQIEGASEEAMISGDVFKGYWKTGHPLELGTPVGGRSDTIRVNFPAGKFSNPPKVHVMLNHIDTDKTSNTRLAVSPTNVTVNGFDVYIETWSDSKVYRVGVAWFAHVE